MATSHLSWIVFLAVHFVQQIVASSDSLLPPPLELNTSLERTLVPTNLTLDFTRPLSVEELWDALCSSLITISALAHQNGSAYPANTFEPLLEQLRAFYQAGTYHAYTGEEEITFTGLEDPIDESAQSTAEQLMHQLVSNFSGPYQFQYHSVFDYAYGRYRLYYALLQRHWSRRQSAEEPADVTVLYQLKEALDHLGNLLQDYNETYYLTGSPWEISPEEDENKKVTDAVDEARKWTLQLGSLKPSSSSRRCSSSQMPLADTPSSDGRWPSSLAQPLDTSNPDGGRQPSSQMPLAPDFPNPTGAGTTYVNEPPSQPPIEAPSHTQVQKLGPYTTRGFPKKPAKSLLKNPFVWLGTSLLSAGGIAAVIYHLKGDGASMKPLHDLAITLRATTQNASKTTLLTLGLSGIGLGVFVTIVGLVYCYSRKSGQTAPSNLLGGGTSSPGSSLTDKRSRRSKVQSSPDSPTPSTMGSKGGGKQQVKSKTRNSRSQKPQEGPSSPQSKSKSVSFGPVTSVNALDSSASQKGSNQPKSSLVISSQQSGANSSVHSGNAGSRNNVQAKQRLT